MQKLADGFLPGEAAAHQIEGNNTNSDCRAKEHMKSGGFVEPSGDAWFQCDKYAEEWAPIAARIWTEKEHPRPVYENYTEEKREHPELAAFEHEN